MKVKNVSVRPHHVGGVLIYPDQTVDIPEQYRFCINADELKEVSEPNSEDKAELEAKEDSKPRGRPAKTSEE